MFRGCDVPPASSRRMTCWFGELLMAGSFIEILVCALPSIAPTPCSKMAARLLSSVSSRETRDLRPQAKLPLHPLPLPVTKSQALLTNSNAFTKDNGQLLLKGSLPLECSPDWHILYCIQHVMFLLHEAPWLIHLFPHQTLPGWRPVANHDCIQETG